MRSDPADILGRLARHWAWTVAFGLLAIAAGILILFWPRETVIVLAVIFGVQLILSGVGELVDAFASVGTSIEPRWLTGLMGALAIFVGIICVRNIFLTLTVIAFMIGVYCAIYGVMRIFSALADRSTPARLWAVLLGALSVVAGIAVLAYPGLTLLYLAIVLGILLVITGIIRVGVALLLRKAHTALST